MSATKLEIQTTELSTSKIMNTSYGVVALVRLEICQKIYTTGFSVQQFYTLNVRNLRLFLLKKKQRKCINLVAFLLELN